MQVKLSKLPDPKSIESVSIGNITGGLNLQSEPDGCASNQSPDMVNMWYENGCLRKRWGQKYIGNKVTGTQAVPVLWYDRLFDGKLVWLQGSSFYYATPAGLANPVAVTGVTIPTSTELGWFVPFEEYLFYKAPGVYIRLKVDDTTHAIVGESVFAKNADGTYTASDLCYTPVIAINRNPDGSGGDSYQPENRIQPKKTVWFDVDDESQDYYLPVHGVDSVLKVQIDDDYIEKTSNGWKEHWADGTERTYTTADPQIHGRVISIENADVDDTSALFTNVHLSAPMDVDGTGWGDIRNHSVEETTGWNYSDNVVWSNYDVYATADAEILHPVVIYPRDECAVPKKYTQSLMAAGLALANATSNSSTGLGCTVFDNGEYCNVLVFNRFSDGMMLAQYSQTWPVHTFTPVKDGNGNNIAGMYTIGFSDYVIASYNYSTGKWTVTDYSGKDGPVGHISTNCVYTTWNKIVSSSATVRYLFGYTTWNYGTMNANAKSLLSPLDKAFVAASSALTSAGINSDLLNQSKLWIAENNEIIGFRWQIGQNPIQVTSVNDNYSAFGACNYVSVAINKTTRVATSGVQIEPSATGFYKSNITYSSFDLVWYGFYRGFTTGNTTVPDCPIIRNSGVELPESYKSYYNYALMRVRDYLGTNYTQLTGNYFILYSEKWHALGFWFESSNGAGKIVKWDRANSEMWMKGMYGIYKDTSVNKPITDISFTTPATLSNRIRVTYSKYNADAFRAIAECKVATDYGGSDAVCITMANCTAQPNALFWSGNGSAGVDPCYFPMDQYNLVGAYQDPITALSKWQSYLIILQEHRTSKGNYNIETNTATSRNFIDIPVATINPERGCDMPRSVRLCSNNLVWAHSTHGVLYLQDTSYANENAVIRISENVNGTKYRPGLLKALADNGVCCSMDDGKRYFLFCGKDMFCWDYSLSSLSDAGVSGLSWTRHELPNTIMSATTCDTRKMYLLDKLGSRIEMGEDYTTDLGAVIPCKYTTPTQTFGGYYKLRNISKVLLKCSSIEGGSFLLRYGGERSSNPANEMDVALKCSQQIDIPAREFDSAIVLRPRILHIHNFYFIIESAGNDGGLAIDNALILYTSQGVTR